MALLAKAFQASRPDTQVTVVPGLGSSGSIKAVAEAALDIGLSGHPLKPAERAQKLVEHELARTPLVLASMRSHAGFTLGDIARIFDGTLRSWPDGSHLRPILRPITDSENALLQTWSPEIKHALSVAHARPGVHIAITDKDSADAIERIPGAIGTSTLALILSEQRPLKALALMGVTPSVAALKSGKYPYYKPLYLVTLPSPSETARAFIAFARSKQGAKILLDNGYLPLD